MTAFIIPLLISFCFIVLFWIKLRIPDFISSEDIFADFVHSKSFSYGQLSYYDNLNEENKNQIPWIFIHSIGSSFYSWRFQIQHFSPSQRIIAVDLLGFGRSDKPALAEYHLDATALRLTEFLDSLDIKSGYLIGCSLGGALCLWLKKLAPERFPKVVTIAPAAISSVVPFSKLSHEKLALLGKRLVSRTIIKVALRGGLSHRNKITADVVENYFAPFKNPDAVISFLKSVSIIKDARLFEGLSSINSPLLVLWGEQDRVIPRSALTKILKQLPKAQLLTHKTGGHHLMEDEPEWTNKAISEFFSTAGLNSESGF